GERQKDASARPHDGICTLVRELGELGVFGLAVDVRHDDAFVTRPIIVSASQSPMRLFSATMAGRWSMSTRFGIQIGSWGNSIGFIQRRWCHNLAARPMAAVEGRRDDPLLPQMRLENVFF